MRRGFGLSLLVLISLQIVEAQSTVYILTREPEEQFCVPLGSCRPGQLLVIDAAGRRLLSQQPITHTRFSGDAYVTPDGRYLLWGGANTLGQFAIMARDAVASITALLLPLPGGISAFSGHPARPEVFLDTGSHSVAISPNGTRTISSHCDWPTIVDVSGDGRRVLQRCIAVPPPTPPFPLAIVDQDTGMLVSTIPDPGRALALSDDGSELYASGDANGSWMFRRYSVTTGEVLAERQIMPTPTINVDPVTGRLFLDRPLGNVDVIDPITLDPIGSIALTPDRLHWMGFDPSQPRAYVLSSMLLPDNVTAHTRLDVIDTASLQVIDGADLALDTTPNAIVVAPRPAVPVGLSAEIADGRVTLSWLAGQSRATTTHYVVEVGSTSGATDLGRIDVGLDTSMVAEPVPSGRYFVRVRAGNFGGSSEASAEVMVNVP